MSNSLAVMRMLQGLQRGGPPLMPLAGGGGGPLHRRSRPADDPAADVQRHPRGDFPRDPVRRHDPCRDLGPATDRGRAFAPQVRPAARRYWTLGQNLQPEPRGQHGKSRCNQD